LRKLSTLSPTNRSLPAAFTEILADNDDDVVAVTANAEGAAVFNEVAAACGISLTGS